MGPHGTPDSTSASYSNPFNCVGSLYAARAPSQRRWSGRRSGSLAPAPHGPQASVPKPPPGRTGGGVTGPPAAGVSNYGGIRDQLRRILRAVTSDRTIASYEQRCAGDRDERALQLDSITTGLFRNTLYKQNDRRWRPFHRTHRTMPLCSAYIQLLSSFKCNGTWWNMVKHDRNTPGRTVSSWLRVGTRTCS